MQGAGYLHLQRAVPAAPYVPQHDLRICSEAAAADEAAVDELAECDCAADAPGAGAVEAALPAAAKVHMYEYHIIFHASYGVPVLMFQARKPGAGSAARSSGM